MYRKIKNRGIPLKKCGFIQLYEYVNAAMKTIYSNETIYSNYHRSLFNVTQYFNRFLQDRITWIVYICLFLCQSFRCEFAIIIMRYVVWIVLMRFWKHVSHAVQGLACGLDTEMTAAASATVSAKTFR